MRQQFVVTEKPRIECRGDNFHLHFGDGSAGLEVVCDVERLCEILRALKPLTLARINETQRALADGSPEFERVLCFERLDSLAAH